MMRSYHHRLYAIVPEALLSSELISQCIETGTATVRRSTDGRVVIKWNARRDAKPDELMGRIEVFTREEMLVELESQEWSR